MASLPLKNLPWYGQLAAFGALSAAACGAFWYFHESPARADMAGRQQQLDALRVEIARGQAIAAKLPQFRAEIADFESRLEGLRAVLPEQKDVADLLRRIQTLATQSNLEIRGFRPQAIVQKQLHAEWPISLELEGTYHDLAAFFDKVSKVPRIINISNIAVTGKDTGTGRSQDAADSGATIAAECLATTFVLSEAPAAPAGQTPAGRPAAQRPAAPGAAAGRS
jgi:type IV pilus assembly protein PilO